MASNFTGKRKYAGPPVEKRFSCSHLDVWWSEDGKWGMCRECTQTLYPDGNVPDESTEAQHLIDG